MNQRAERDEAQSHQSRPSLRRRWTALLVATWVLSTAPGWSAGTPVPPGSLVRWPGQGVERCGQGDRVWTPILEECWYPIDLLAPAGKITVSRWRDGRREETSLEVGPYPYEVQHITLQDDTKVNLSAEDLRRVERENGMIAALWDRESPRLFVLPLGQPLEDLPAGGRFGSRRFFNNQPRSPHTGTDFAADTGTPILSVAAGTVVLSGDFFFSGRSVFVDHGDGLISMYFHLSGIAVDEGDEVKRGEILGLVGQSGRATGPHLHFGARWHGARVDPGLLLGSPDELPSIIR